MASETQSIVRSNQYRVKLVSVWSPYSRVEFEITPTFSENRSVEYTPVTPIHMPGSIMIYKNSASRTFSVGSKLISRNTTDILRNMMYLQILRSWTMPYFGQSRTDTLQSSRVNSERQDMESRLNQPNEQQLQAQQINRNNQDINATQTQLDNVRRNAQFGVLGAPPDVLYLYAYSTEAHDERGVGFVNINRVPVVLTSLGITYPEDVDYLPNPGNNEPFPTRLDLTLELAETHSPREFEQFSLFDYKFGNLKRF